MDRHVSDPTRPKRAPAQRLLERQTERFLRKPPTVRNAAAIIVTITTFIVVISAVAMRIFDATDFPNIWLALWWSVQTATTVGYGDVTPKNAEGRIVATVVMLEGIAFLAILTAAITSTFVARAQKELGGPGEDWTARFDELADRLDRLEELLQADHPHRTMPPPGTDA